MIHYKFTENLKSNLKGKTKWTKYLQMQNNNRMDVKGTGCEAGWVQWRALVQMVMNFQVL